MSVLYIRNIDAGAVHRIKRAAQSRGMTLPQYLGQLSLLHERVRGLADQYVEDPHTTPGDRLQGMLIALGLQTTDQ